MILKVSLLESIVSKVGAKNSTSNRNYLRLFIGTETITISESSTQIFGKMTTPMPTKNLILSAALKKFISYFAKEREMLMQLFFRNLLQFQSSKLLEWASWKFVTFSESKVDNRKN